MDHESEVIRQQMAETRTALAEKLETLEQQVVSTVHGATCAVTDTVEAVKEAVQESVDKVKGSVEETVETVRETFDLQRQVERHPWPMMTGSVLLGYVAGSLLDRGEQESLRFARRGQLYAEPDRSARGAPRTESPGRFDFAEPAAKPNGAHAAAPTAAVSDWFGEVGKTFEQEISKVKGLAIGALIGVVRDLVTPSVPEQLKPDVNDVMNSITVKLGGKPIRGPILKDLGGSCSHSQGAAYGRRHVSELGRPLGAS